MFDTVDLRTLTVCPACRSSLTWSPDTAKCAACPETYQIADGIPILLARNAGNEDTCQKAKQAHYFAQDDTAEFEIDRPHGTPGLHQWLLGEKLRRSITELRPVLSRAIVLSACGGSGMDAEFLARAGARVILADISLGAAERAQERARRYQLPITPIVADVEQLPFADRSVDVAYVHDGLHHLERPLAGLGEMARVAREAISVNEPARAAVTAFAIRVGIAREYEEAGNRVARLTLAEVERVLGDSGFRILRSQRYAMYYRHEPGRVVSCLSLPGAFRVAALGFRGLNTLAGRIGNKLSVQALRSRESDSPPSTVCRETGDKSFS